LIMWSHQLRLALKLGCENYGGHADHTCRTGHAVYVYHAVIYAGFVNKVGQADKTVQLIYELQHV
jgi:hypothetical protein